MQEKFMADADNEPKPEDEIARLKGEIGEERTAVITADIAELKTLTVKLVAANRKNDGSATEAATAVADKKAELEAKYAGNENELALFNLLHDKAIEEAQYE